MSPDAHHEHGKRSMSDEPNAMLILYNLLVFVAFVVCLVLYHTGLGILVTSVEMTIDPYGLLRRDRHGEPSADRRNMSAVL